MCLLAHAAPVRGQHGDEDPGPPPLIISEFRLSGPGGELDEFVEIYNNSDLAVTVQTADDSPGFALVASDGVTRFVIPNGTVIPARGHFLGVNSAGYSLGDYPSGGGATAAGDAAYTSDIPDNDGIALFATSDPANFGFDRRLDAVGSNWGDKALYREGGGYTPLDPARTERSFTRKLCSAPATCAGLPRDTGDNAADFIYVETHYDQAGWVGRGLGAPGPEGLSSPAHRGGPGLDASLLDPLADAYASPNYSRDHTPGDGDAAFGTVSFRRTFTNNTGGDITALRFRVADITTAVAPAGKADLRPRSSGPLDVTLSDGSTAAVRGTTLEEPPSQSEGGGFNSSLAAGTVTLSTPLAAGGSLSLQFAAAVEQKGDFRYCVTAETLPAASSRVLCFVGNTETGAPTPTPTPTPMPTPTPTPSPVGCTMTFSNPAPILLPRAVAQPFPATPYPSGIPAAGFLGPVQKVRVRLSDFSHTYTRAVDVLLVGPDGRNALVMSDVGVPGSSFHATLTLDDAARSPLTYYGALTTGTFRPTNFNDFAGGDGFPLPAPTPTGQSALSVFNGSNPNGVWSLYVFNDSGVGEGQFAGGWSIEITAGCPDNSP